MRTLIWDFDGTLGYREGAWSGALLEALTRAVPMHTLTAAQLRPHLLAGFPWHAHEQPFGGPRTADDWWLALNPVFAGACSACGLPEETAREVAVGVRAAYLDPAAWRRFDDALPTLQSLSAAGWRHVLLSNHVPELRAILTHLELLPLFDAVVNSAELGYEKPHPAAFRAAIAAAKGATELWIIGDNPLADVRGAETVGLPAILVRREAAGVRFQCPDLTGVAAILDEQSGRLGMAPPAR